MGEKRQYDNAETGPSAKRYKEMGGDYGGGPRHQQPGFKKNTRRPESSNWAKKRARTIERRLRNPGSLPANVQQDLERELVSLNRQVEGRQDKRLRAHMIGKYHMLRFFERKKAARRQKQLQKRYEATDDPTEKAEIEADLRIAEIDVLYPQYFPFLEPYVSLYPQSGKKGGGEKGEGKDAEEEEEEDKDAADGKQSAAAQFFRGPRPPMWDLIKTTYEKGGTRALQAIRDRQPAKEGKEGKEGKAGKAAAETNGDKPSKKTKEAKKVGEDPESDDGGFFGDS